MKCRSMVSLPLLHPPAAYHAYLQHISILSTSAARFLAGSDVADLAAPPPPPCSTSTYSVPDNFLTSPFSSEVPMNDLAAPPPPPCRAPEVLLCPTKASPADHKFEQGSRHYTTGAGGHSWHRRWVVGVHSTMPAIACPHMTCTTDQSSGFVNHA